MRKDEARKKEQVAAVFGRAAPTYDNTGRFTHFGRRLVGAVSLEPGVRVLDIAAGRGAILFPAAEQVGSDGKVTGIDLSEPMVTATAAEIQRLGLTQAEVFCMDAEHLTFEPASFDAVFCGFSIQYFPELAQTLSEFRRMLRPGGVLALSTWGKGDPRWARLQKLRRGYGVGERMGGIRLRDPADVEAVMRKSGFEPASRKKHSNCCRNFEVQTDSPSVGRRSSREVRTRRIDAAKRPVKKSSTALSPFQVAGWRETQYSTPGSFHLTKLFRPAIHSGKASRPA
jgi:ubiquinone/menaquinone biosynthesis C-methylase UbiE